MPLEKIFFLQWSGFSPKRNGFLFPSSYPLELVALVHFWSGLNLCGSCACCHGLCEFIHASVLLCLEDTVYLEPSTTSGSWVFLPPLLYTLLSLEGGIWWRQSIWNWVLQSLSHCTRCFCEFLYRFPSNVGRSFSDDGWAIHWPESFTPFFLF